MFAFGVLFSRGCLLCGFDKISKPAKSNSAELCRLFHLLQYCDSGGVIFAGLFRPFVLPPPHRMGHVAAWSFYLPLCYVDGGTMCGLFRQLPILFHWAHCIRRFYLHAKKSAPRSGRQKFNTSKNYIFLRFQMSSAYSLIVRSDEKRPMRAVLSIAIFAQRGLSLKASSAFFWASQ